MNRALAPVTRRPSREQAFIDKAEEHRAQAESLVRGAEVLMRKIAELDVMPLDVLSRYERAVMKAHTTNLLRVSTYTDKALVEDEA